jgi:hypothetical protein
LCQRQGLRPFAICGLRACERPCLSPPSPRKCQILLRRILALTQRKPLKPADAGKVFFSSYLAGSGIENIGEYFKIFFEPSLRGKRISEDILKYSLYPSLRGRRISEDILKYSLYPSLRGRRISKDILKYSLYPSLRGRRTEPWRLYQKKGQLRYRMFLTCFIHRMALS